MILDETDSGLDIDALRAPSPTASTGSMPAVRVLLITALHADPALHQARLRARRRQAGIAEEGGQDLADEPRPKATSVTERRCAPRGRPDPGRWMVYDLQSPCDVERIRKDFPILRRTRFAGLPPPLV